MRASVLFRTPKVPQRSHKLSMSLGYTHTFICLSVVKAVFSPNFSQLALLGRVCSARELCVKCLNQRSALLLRKSQKFYDRCRRDATTPALVHRAHCPGLVDGDKQVALGARLFLGRRVDNVKLPDLRECDEHWESANVERCGVFENVKVNGLASVVSHDLCLVHLGAPKSRPNRECLSALRCMQG
jgi:hypothetical protein